MVAQAAREQSLGVEHPDTMSVAKRIGSTYIKTGDFTKAEDILRATTPASYFHYAEYI